MKVALVHEFLNQLGGAEKVLENFLEIWPDADVHVLLYDRDKTLGQFEVTHKKLSWLQNFPLAKKHPRLLLILMPRAIENFSFDEYDVVISDASAFAKGAKTGNKLHICFCHTPTRYLWTEPDYLNNQKYPALFKWLGRMTLSRLKKWDYKAAQRPNFFIANSKNVQNRIAKFYNRQSTIIYPPVDTEFFKPTGSKAEYYFAASRLEPYKKLDIVIRAFNELKLPLKIGGSGTQSEELKKLANSNIEFLGRVSDQNLRKLYAQAKAFIFPAEEDAGIMLLEAQSCGTPVIAYRAGGALELVKEGVTGEYFDQQTPESLKQKLLHFDPAQYQSQTIREFAKQFDKLVFQKKIKEFVENKYQQSLISK
jgi:glycosyltransferase involved in cell wall biosynthesis